MGAYDIVQTRNRSRVGQVKLWGCEFRTYKPGDMVPISNRKSTYSVAMREGGYLNIVDNRLTSWTDEPEVKPVLDKYGGEFNIYTTGPLGESIPADDPYFFKDKRLPLLDEDD